MTTTAPAHQSVVVQDSTSGVASIFNIVVVNGSVSVPSFGRGDKGPIMVVATKTNPALPTRWSFEVTDGAGQTVDCK